MLEQLLESYPDNVKVVFKNFPLQNHEFAMQAAIAALSADDQGKFWEFHDLLFKNYNRLNDQIIRDIALGIGLDEKKFEQKLKDPALQAKIRQDLQDGRSAGVNGTPFVFINGKILRNRTLEGFQLIIDKELQKLDRKVVKPTY